MATLGTRLHTFLRGKFVGKDEFGNVYYTERRPRKGARAKRWVMYKGIAEPSKVPAHWHGWLHYTLDKPPVAGAPPRKFPWQKEHLPNLTGTTARYLPPGHVLKGAKRDRTASDYVAWKP